MSASAAEIGAATLERLARANEERRAAGEELKREIAAHLAAHPDICAKALLWKLTRPVKLRRVQQVMKDLRSALGGAR